MVCFRSFAGSGDLKLVCVLLVFVLLCWLFVWLCCVVCVTFAYVFTRGYNRFLISKNVPPCVAWCSIILTCFMYSGQTFDFASWSVLLQFLQSVDWHVWPNSQSVPQVWHCFLFLQNFSLCPKP